ncbi:acidic leucine-rich nuclear phosphoprotein 32-related protein 1-like [Quercus lobata]|uniref:acidic leucine-rich nuclear phosphoprotein 32-related protein 1-like n=1 Tax=Quercus lobata TaxID=97700 RepID=UPI001247A9CE|nr:acidic leucine-rich nuclear phosphoprotein 32-related protein 1-like [Quercus lobata]
MEQRKNKEDLGTEYLVRPVARVEDEEDASDFEPKENGGKEEEIDEEDEDEDGGKVDVPAKRKRSDKDDSDDDDDGGEDDERPSNLGLCLLTALAVGSQPQNYHPNPCFVEEEKDLDIEQEGCDIKEDDEYIERVCLVDWDSPIYDDYPEDFSQGEKIELDKNKVIYI